jgi:uncharacterized protein (UPF0333 family)
MDKKINDKKGQVTLFIILGIILVATIILVFYFYGKINFTSNPSNNPREYMINCMEDSAREAEEIILKNNGYPQLNIDNYIHYNKERVPYQCTVSEFYTPCIPQEPGFFSYVSRLMENKVAKDTESCLQVLLKDFEDRGYSVQVDPGNTTLKIQKEFVNIIFGKRIYATKAEESIQISNIETTYSTRLYDLLKLVQTIVNYESTICEFNKMNWMRYDNSIAIFTTRTSDQTKIYTLRERLTDREIKFAIKTCVQPAGI